MTRTIALSCPLCGGAVEPPVDGRQVACGYCGRKLHYAGEDFVSRLYLKPTLAGEDLQRKFFQAFHSALVPADLGRRAVVLHRRRIFFPLYLVSGTRGGVLHTVKERLVHDFQPPLDLVSESGLSKSRGVRALEGAKASVESTPDVRVVLGDFHYVYSAAAADEWDFDSAVLQDLAKENMGGAVPAVLADLAKNGEVLEATIPIERVLEMGVTSGRRIAGDGTELLETTVRILYVPLVEIVFRIGEQIHRILFEEIAGAPLAGRLPFRRELAFLVGVPMACATGFILGRTARLFSFDPEWSSAPARDLAVVWCVFAAVAIGLFAAGLRFAWSLLRAPVDVELMTGGGLKVSAAAGGGDSQAGPLWRFLASTAEALLNGGRR
jgi:hypothetical protein